MKFLIHNKLTIKQANKTYCFYNQMQSSIYDKLSSFESYFNCIAFGLGSCSHDNESNKTKLSNHIATYSLHEDLSNFDISNGMLFSQKVALLDDSRLDGKLITEAGITSSTNNDPIVYNYFSLKNNDLPDGLKKIKGQTLEICICIYLELSNDGIGFLTAGKNPFIEYLLGDGFHGNKVYAIRGNIYLDNIITYREKPNVKDKFECSVFISNEDGLTIKFSANLLKGETHEIVFLLGDEPFARINVEKQKPTIRQTNTFSPKTNYVIDLGENITNVISVKNSSKNQITLPLNMQMILVIGHLFLLMNYSLTKLQDSYLKMVIKFSLLLMIQSMLI